MVSVTKIQTTRAAPIPRALRQRVMGLLSENYAYMDSPTFRHKNVERELFTPDAERELPLTSWYQPTRDDLHDSSGSPPQLMSGAEERMMFLRFNYSKKRLQALAAAHRPRRADAEVGAGHGGVAPEV